MKGRTEIENKGAYAIYNWIELARAKPKHGGLVFVSFATFRPRISFIDGLCFTRREGSSLEGAPSRFMDGS